VIDRKRAKQEQKHARVQQGKVEKKLQEGKYVLIASTSLPEWCVSETKKI
jgi:hypothetical protein